MIKYIIVGPPIAVMFFVIVVLALGPVFIEIRDWFMKGGHF